MRLSFTLLLIFPLIVNAAEIVPVTGKHCVITKNISIADLANKSGIIFRGKFEDFSIVEEDGLTIRKLFFRVKEAIRGLDSNSKKLVLKEWAKIHSPFSAEEIARDQDYVFFFNRPSSKGLTSLNGMEQGLVAIEDNDTLRYSNRLELGNDYSSSTRSMVTRDTMNLASYEGLKKFCALSKDH